MRTSPGRLFPDRSIMAQISRNLIQRFSSSSILIRCRLDLTQVLLIDVAKCEAVSHRTLNRLARDAEFYMKRD